LGHVAGLDSMKTLLRFKGQSQQG